MALAIVLPWCGIVWVWLLPCPGDGSCGPVYCPALVWDSVALAIVLPWVGSHSPGCCLSLVLGGVAPTVVLPGYYVVWPWLFSCPRIGSCDPGSSPEMVMGSVTLAVILPGAGWCSTDCCSALLLGHVVLNFVLPWYYVM